MRDDCIWRTPSVGMPSRLDLLTAAIARQHLRLGQIGRPVLVGIAEDELARLQRRARPRRRLVTRSLDHRLRQPVPEPEVIVGVIERRRRVQIQYRQTAHTVAPGHQLVVHPGGPRMFSVVAREQDRDRMQVGARQPAHPIVRVGGPGIAQDVGPSRHALAKRLRERCQGFLGNPQRPQAVPRERQRDPPLACCPSRLAPRRRSRPPGSARTATPGRRPDRRTTGTHSGRSSPACGSAECAECHRTQASVHVSVRITAFGRACRKTPL